VIPCIVVVGYEHFGGVCFLYLQGEETSTLSSETLVRYRKLHGITTQKTST